MKECHQIIRVFCCQVTWGNVSLFEDTSNALFSVGALTHSCGLTCAICPVGSAATSAHKLVTLDVETGANVNIDGHQQS